MSFGLPWSEAFVRQLSDKEMRDAFVADQVRSRIAQLVRVLREQEGRGWTQGELGERAGKRQNAISRLENPDEAQPSVQTLLEICSAFDLPLWIDFPEWEDWLVAIKDVPSSKTVRHGFEQGLLSNKNHPKAMSSNIAYKVVGIAGKFAAPETGVSSHWTISDTPRPTPQFA